MTKRQDTFVSQSPDTARGPVVFFSVGEPSGDLHGASLIDALGKQAPDVRCVGFGGPRMAAAGCELLADLTELAIMWFARALIHLPRFLGLLRQADCYFRDCRPDCVVLIDYPGFNWWIARRAKKHGIPVVYYGTPQIWAWARWRIHKMRRLTDHVLCKLPFETPWFRARGCNAHYIGHPYFDHLASRHLDTDFIAKLRAPRGDSGNSSSPLVTILPGSRTQEVTKNLPAFLRTAHHVRAKVPTVRLAIASFNASQARLAQEMVSASKLPIEIHVDRTPELIEAADCCMACSGSVSLELLYHQRPSVILYTISRWANLVQSRFRKVRYITLANLLADTDIFTEVPFTYDPDLPGAVRLPFPEYLTSTDRSADIAAHLVHWLTDSAARHDKARELASLRANVLGTDESRGRASDRAAEYILTQVLHHHRHGVPASHRPHWETSRGSRVTTDDKNSSAMHL